MMHRFLLVALLAVPLAAGAQSGPLAGEAPAVTAYHAGARQFIDGDIGAAAATVDAALAATPQDARLRALRELIRQQQNDGGGGEQPDDSDSSRPDENAPPDPSAGDQNEPESPDSGPGDEPNDAPGTQPPGQPSDGGASPGRPQGMSRAEAEALLDAVGGDERLLLRQLRREASPGPRPERDW
jgi:hypothetical protein